MHSERCTVLAHGNGSFPSDQPLTLGQELVERPSAEHVEVIKEVAQCETQQVQKQENKPEPQLVERIDETRLTETHDHIFEVPRSIARRSSSRFQRQRFSSWRDMFKVPVLRAASQTGKVDAKWCMPTRLADWTREPQGSKW